MYGIAFQRSIDVHNKLKLGLFKTLVLKAILENTVN